MATFCGQERIGDIMDMAARLVRGHALRGLSPLWALTLPLCSSSIIISKQLLLELVHATQENKIRGPRLDMVL